MLCICHAISCQVYVQILHDEYNYYVLQTCTKNKNKITKSRELINVLVLVVA